MLQQKTGRRDDNWPSWHPRLLCVEPAWNSSLLFLLQSLQSLLLFYERPVLKRGELSGTFVLRNDKTIYVYVCVLNKIVIIENKFKKILQID